MKILFALLCVIINACAIRTCENPEICERRGDGYPAVCHIQNFFKTGTTKHTGVLIAPRVILTCAHSYQDSKTDLHPSDVNFSIVSFSKTGDCENLTHYTHFQIIQSWQILVHPSFQIICKVGHIDIALLFLQQEVMGITPLDILRKNPERPMSAMIVGYGKGGYLDQKTFHTPSTKRRAANIFISPFDETIDILRRSSNPGWLAVYYETFNTECNLQKPSFINGDQGEFMLLSHTLSASENGDSGGPIIIDGKIVAIVSAFQNIEYATGQKGSLKTFQILHNHKKWIDAAINEFFERRKHVQSLWDHILKKGPDLKNLPHMPQFLPHATLAFLCAAQKSSPLKGVKKEEHVLTQEHHEAPHEAAHEGQDHWIISAFKICGSFLLSILEKLLTN